MNNFPIGIIGCGYIAKKAFLPILSTLPDVTINMILSQSTRNWDVIKSSWPQLQTTTNWSEFLNSGIKAAFILTPVDSHFELCAKLLDEGIHVFVEKPPTTSAKETLQIAQKAQEKELVFMVGFNRRYSTPVLKVLDQIKEDQIRLCVVEKHRPSHQERDLAETYREDLIHQVDLLRMFCGELIPTSTTSTQVEGNLLSSISSLKNSTHGLGVVLHSRESGRWQERVTIIGNEKTLQVNMFQSVIEIDSDRSKPIWVSQSNNTQLDDRGFREEINHFLNCVNTNANPLTNGFEAAKSQELQEQLVALNHSQARSGK